MKKIIYLFTIVPLCIFAMDEQISPVLLKNDHLLKWSEKNVRKQVGNYFKYPSVLSITTTPPFPFKAQKNYASNFEKAEPSFFNGNLNAHKAWQAYIKAKDDTKTLQNSIEETKELKEAHIEQDALGSICSPTLAKWYLYKKQYSEAIAFKLISKQKIDNFFC